MARKSKKNLGDSNLIGLGTQVATAAQTFFTKYYARRRILTVPKEIAAKNPDKHFCFINMNKLQKNGMWHQQGYRLYDAKRDLESMESEKFNTPIDSYIHRNEMVLAWIPKEEFELRQLEAQVVRGKRKVTDIITKSEILAQNFSPHAKETSTIHKFPETDLNGGVNG